jgi:hypothetical protein
LQPLQLDSGRFGSAVGMVFLLHGGMRKTPPP